MEKMARAFNTTVPNLEDELSNLILEGQIQARIDSHNKVNGKLTRWLKRMGSFFFLKAEMLYKYNLCLHVLQYGQTVFE